MPIVLTGWFESSTLRCLSKTPAHIFISRLYSAIIQLCSRKMLYTYATRLLSVCFVVICPLIKCQTNSELETESSPLMRDKLLKMIHQNCRRGLYPSSNINRTEVPEDKVPWTSEFPDYEPADYTSPSIHGKPWADPDIADPEFKPKWNDLDGNVSRKSFVANYTITAEGYPLNPIGRTGIIGRGLLGRWGPNHAADPIVTRWKRNGTGAVEISRVTENPILQFVAVQRKDTGDWALPGGMVDPGELVNGTLKREFMEEAMNSLEKTEAEVEELKAQLDKCFEKGDEIYRGYVDDGRNTDNAWMETVALNFHDEDGSLFGQMELKAGDDAGDVRWTDVNKELKLYASHGLFVKKTAQKHNAHW